MLPETCLGKMPAKVPQPSGSIPVKKALHLRWNSFRYAYFTCLSMVKRRPYLMGGWVGGFGNARLYLVCALLMLQGVAAHAQRRTFNWYFGREAAVNFSTGVPQPLTDSRINTEEGCATASDPATGKLLFYTDGVTVWNQFHQPMPSGTGLHGDASTSQSALILQWPGSAGLYAIFSPAPITSSDPGGRCYCLKYSLVDMRRDAGFGDVILKDVQLDADVTEHVTAAPDCGQGGWWIIVRRRETSEFASYHITSEGIVPQPVLSPIVNLPEIRDAGQMHASPDARFVVITSPSGSSQLFRFNRATGKLFSGIDLFGTDRTGIHYGATFSRDSRFLFVASSVVAPEVGVVITRYNVADEDANTIKSSRTIVGKLPGSASFCPLQLGPDGAVYIGRSGRKLLSSIPNPSASSPTIVDSAVVLYGECRSGLPNFVNWYLSDRPPSDQTCKLPVANSIHRRVCVGADVKLLDLSQGQIDNWSWIIPGGQPSSSRQPSPTVRFDVPGTYLATLVVSNQYGDDTTHITVTVHPLPTIFVAPLIRTCPGTPVRLPASGAQSYRWSPSQGLDGASIADPLATVWKTTVFNVVGTDANGCTAASTVTVEVLDLAAGEDVTICPGGTAQLSASAAEFYQWWPTADLDDPNSPTPKASPSQTTMYTVKMTAGSCTITDTVFVFVEQTFNIHLSAPPSACAGDVVTVRALGGGSAFEWSGNGVAPSNTSETTVRVSAPTVVRVRATSGACTSIDSVVIGVTAGPSVDASPDTTICPSGTALLRASGNALRYHWFPPQGLLEDTGSVVRAQPETTTTYYVTGVGEGACQSVDSITVTVRSAPTISAGPVKRMCIGGSVRLSATGMADSYSWHPATGLDDPTTLAPIASPTVTTTYTLTATRGGCVTVDSATVFVSSLTLVVPSSVRICYGSAAELSASGAATYRWTPSTGLSDPSIPNPIASPLESTTYRVVGTDAIGCEDIRFVTVTVIDTASIVIRIPTLTAQAGTDDMEMPVLVETDPELLPFFADTLRAELYFPPEVLYPYGWEVGLRSIGYRDSTKQERKVVLLQFNVQVVNPQQRINTLYGRLLAGKTTDATFYWEGVRWLGVTCPSNASAPGRLLVTGCNLKGRSLRFFDQTTVRVTPHEQQHTIEVEIGGSEPGTFTYQLVGIDGSVLVEGAAYRNQIDDVPINLLIDMSAVGSGLYHLVVAAPSEPHITRVLWLP
jgi:PKD repeat protein